MKFTPEDFSKLETKELANVVRKLNAGKTLNSTERSLLEQAKSASGPEGLSLAAEGFAASWDELAAALSVDERSLFNFRRRHAKRVKELRRKLTRADGRHCVGEWRKLGDELGELRGKGINNPDADYVDERALRLRERQLAVEREEHKLAVARDQVLPVVEFQTELGAMVGAFHLALNQMPGRAAQKIAEQLRSAVLAQLRPVLTEKQFEKAAEAISTPIDYAAIEEILHSENTLIKRTLGECRFLPAS